LIVASAFSDGSVCHFNAWGIQDPLHRVRAVRDLQLSVLAADRGYPGELNDGFSRLFGAFRGRVPPHFPAKKSLSIIER
jgi:hypothetical protein